MNLANLLYHDHNPLQTLIIEQLDNCEEISVSRADFIKRVETYDCLLREQQLAPRSRVAIVASNGIDNLAGFFAILRSGYVAVPVNHKLSPDLLDYIYQDAEIRFTLTDRAHQKLVSCRTPLVVMDDVADYNHHHSAADQFEVKEDDDAFILYTSGSSGNPKGVPLTHGGYQWALACLTEYAAGAKGQKMLAAAPLFHMNALFLSMLQINFGGTVILMRRFTPLGYLTAIDRHRCAAITAVPAMLAMIAREQQSLKQMDLSCVTQITIGSAPSTDELIRQVSMIFPNARVLNGWGTTESGPISFFMHPEGIPTPPMSLGYPSPHVEMKLIDGSSDNEGILFIKNRCMTRGYLNLPEQTAERFRNGWYNTGDIMRKDPEGFYYFVSRADDMINCGGENIFPGAIENLLETHPAVNQAAVVPVVDNIKHQLPVAFVVCSATEQPSESQLQQFTRDNGPIYAYPRAIWFLDRLPLIGPNKIDKRALTKLAEQRYLAS